MKTIYKYPFKIDDHVVVKMPKGASILLTGIQKIENPCFWAIVDSEAEQEDRHFRIFGTGHPFDLEKVIPYENVVYQYLGSLLMYNDSLVFHVFEVAIHDCPKCKKS
jgi:hypothetical protein